MTTSKKSIARLVEICYQWGIRDVVFSPGSRNAPLIIAFTQSGKFNIYNIPDERVAAFYAMGLSLQSGKPSIICCTSGTAALNYAPAICEAYYQYIPLLVLTADRPIEKIDQGIGQSMRQKDVYRNYIKQSYQLIQEAESEEDLLTNDEIIIDAIKTTLTGNLGPSHINIPLQEPLYVQFDYRPELSIKAELDVEPAFTLSEELKSKWNISKRKLLICGQMAPSAQVEQMLSGMVGGEQIVLMSESTSNVFVKNGIQCIDRVIDSLFSSQAEFKPDLLVYLGGQIISKKVKKLFSEFGIKDQWHINPESSKDTFGGLTEFIKTSEKQFLSELKLSDSVNDLLFQNAWKDLNATKKATHYSLVPKMKYSDLSVFAFLLSHLPDNSVLHSSNSTVIRYIQLFDQRKDLRYRCNRGVSGIDGSTSTALGYAQNSDKTNFLITGDISFFYDSNSFWHKHIPDNFKIILINNEGGSIFRIIPGPKSTDALEEHFEAHHQTEAIHLAMMYDLDYFRATDEKELEEQYSLFLNSNIGRAQILEIVTPRLENDKVLKEYFKLLK